MAETRLQPADVVVVGLGAAGGTAVLPLAEAGLDVIGLEAGGRLSARDFASDEIKHDVHNWMGRVKVNNEVPTWRPNADAEAGPGAINIRMMNAVGGTSIHYGMQFWRLLPWNFRTRSETIKRYGAGAIPRDSTVTDWPLTYEELEPYYDRVEYLIGVSGKAGNIKGRKDPAGNPFEGARAREFPLPPLRRSGYLEKMGDAARSLGYHPFPGPASIRSEPYEGLPGCNYCGFCSPNGCHVNAKGSTFLNGIPQAETAGLKVVTYARVTEIVAGNDGKVTGVRYRKGGRAYFQPASVVLLATYTYENVRMLLLSKSRAFENGLANRNGQVGKHYMSHVYCGVNALFPGEKLNRWTGSAGQYVCYDDFDSDNFDHGRADFIGGGNIAATMEVHPITAANTTPPSIPRWGGQWKAWLRENANSVGGAFGQLESLPYEDTFLDLDPTKTDPQGFPVIRATFDLHPQEQARYDFIYEKCEEVVREAGASETWAGFPKLPIAVNSHAYGGTRMGDDPEGSVVDKWCMAHEVPNLGILGASSCPTTGGRNPTGTVQALAWRTADHIVKNWRSITR
jgi:gluconate 2-dehydrogenase alpha chain